jgi:hypothetical protein
MDSHLGDPLSDRFNIPWIASREPLDPDLDTCSGLKITQTIKPLSKLLGLSDLNHRYCSLSATLGTSTCDCPLCRFGRIKLAGNAVASAASDAVALRRLVLQRRLQASDRLLAQPDTLQPRDMPQVLRHGGAKPEQGVHGLALDDIVVLVAAKPDLAAPEKRRRSTPQRLHTENTNTCCSRTPRYSSSCNFRCATSKPSRHAAQRRDSRRRRMGGCGGDMGVDFGAKHLSRR